MSAELHFYHSLVSYSFSSFAKSILKCFLPMVPWNCTSTNSVPCSMMLLRMMPSPNLSCNTLSPGLNRCTLGFAGGGGGVGCAGWFALASLFFIEDDGGTVGEV